MLPSNIILYYIVALKTTCRQKKQYNHVDLMQKIVNIIKQRLCKVGLCAHTSLVQLVRI